MLDVDRLPVYREARAFRVVANRIAGKTPRGESDLSGQLKSAANSIVENIAEGAGEFSAAEKARSTESLVALPRSASASQTCMPTWMRLTKKPRARRASV